MMYFHDQMAIHRCSFCLVTNEYPDESDNHRRTRHYGEECIVCTKCQGELWKVHQASPSNCAANWVNTAPGVYSGAKKQRLSEPSMQTLEDEKCKQFTEFVLSQWRMAIAARTQATHNAF